MCVIWGGKEMCNINWVIVNFVVVVNCCDCLVEVGMVMVCVLCLFVMMCFYLMDFMFMGDFRFDLRI